MRKFENKDADGFFSNPRGYYLLENLVSFLKEDYVKRRDDSTIRFAANNFENQDYHKAAYQLYDIVGDRSKKDDVEANFIGMLIEGYTLNRGMFSSEYSKIKDRRANYTENFILRQDTFPHGGCSEKQWNFKTSQPPFFDRKPANAIEVFSDIENVKRYLKCIKDPSLRKDMTLSVAEEFENQEYYRGAYELHMLSGDLNNAAIIKNHFIAANNISFMFFKSGEGYAAGSILKRGLMEVNPPGRYKIT